MVFLIIDCMENRKSGDKSFLHNFKPLYTFPFPKKSIKRSPPLFPPSEQRLHKSQFLQNWAVRNPAGTGLDSSQVNKQIDVNIALNHFLVVLGGFCWFLVVLGGS